MSSRALSSSLAPFAPSCILAWPLIISFLTVAAAASFFLLARLEIVLFTIALADTLPDFVQRAASTTELYTGVWPFSSRPFLLLHHNFIEIGVFHIVPFLSNAFLKLADLVQIVALLLVLRLHLEVFERLVELLVLCPLLLLLKRLYLDLLFEQAAFHLGHVGVRFEHLREKVVRS